VSASSEARTYASVVFETAIKDWLSGLEVTAGVLHHSPELVRMLTDQTKSFEARQAALLPLLPESTPKPVRNFVLGMLANGDIALIEEVVSELRDMAASAGGPRPTVAEVTAAVELTPTERTSIEERLVEQFGTGLEFTFKVDPAILGGLVIRVGDKLLDNSVASRMAALRQSLGVSSR